MTHLCPFTQFLLAIGLSFWPAMDSGMKWRMKKLLDWQQKNRMWEERQCD
jgi:hypothetical protein